MIIVNDSILGNVYTVSLCLKERLPWFIQGPCHIECQYMLKYADNKKYYLLWMQYFGMVDTICQRCAKVFTQKYTNINELALCATDDLAKTLLKNYETVVLKANKFDINELVIDDLFLYLPQKHDNIIC